MYLKALNQFETEICTTIHDLPCVILRVSFGDRHRCGYVGIPESHPFFGIQYNQEIPNATRDMRETINNNPVEGIGWLTAFCYDGISIRPDVLLTAHGGITYSNGTWPGMPHSYPAETQEPIWWFGFDAAHCDDNREGGQPLDYMFNSAKNLAKQLNQYK